MPFTDKSNLRLANLWTLSSLLLLVAACSQRGQPPAHGPAPAPSAARPAPSGAPAAAATASTRTWDEYQRIAAQRIVQANPNGTYMGTVPQPSLAIPVLEVELNSDGSIRNIVVQRRPGQATDTVQLAVDAVRRAAPFPSVSHLPRPWKFTEVFLFDDNRRFKPRTLDQ